MHRKSLITGLLIAIIVGMLAVIVLGSKTKTTMKNQVPQITTKSAEATDQLPIFFYGNTCPHCAEVETWMKENKIEEKISLIKKEVYENQQNAQELAAAAQRCGLSTNSIGVPFLFAEGKCLIGTPDVIDYLSQKVGVIEASESAERSHQ